MIHTVMKPAMPLARCPARDIIRVTGEGWVGGGAGAAAGDSSIVVLFLKKNFKREKNPSCLIFGFITCVFVADV